MPIILMTSSPRGGQFGYLSSQPPPRGLNRRQIAAYVCLPPFSSIGVFFYTVFGCYFLKPLCQCISDEACERRLTFIVEKCQQDCGDKHSFIVLLTRENA